MRFWNDTLLQLGCAFRLGSIANIPEQISFKDVRPYSNMPVRARKATPRYQTWSTVPEDGPWSGAAISFATRIGRTSGDIIVALTDNDRTSFVTDRVFPGKMLAVIQGQPYSPGIQIQNVVAHELGHVIGLGHNSEPGALMCGPIYDVHRCNGWDLRDGFLALTDEDKASLLAMYPPLMPPVRRPWNGDPPVIPNLRFGGPIRTAS